MASLDTHLRLFDLLARARRYVTCTGCTDDHEGLIGSWSSRTNRYATGIWAPSLSDVDVRAALASGQAWCLEVEDSGTVNTIDLMVDGVVPMGSVSVRPVATRTVQLTCPTVPSGATAEFIRGVVDGNDSDLTHRVTTFATATTADLRAGTVSRTVDTTSDCFVRVQIRNSGGTIVAFSNPIWLFRAEPPGGIPANRRAPDVPPGTRSAATTTTTGHDHDGGRNDHDDGGPTTTTTCLPGPSPTPPVTTPAAGSKVTSPVAITGTATDDAGVAAVRFAIRDQVTRLWLQPNGTFRRLRPALGHAGRPERQVDGVLGERRPAAGSYGLSVRATDVGGTVETTDAWVVFTVA